MRSTVGWYGGDGLLAGQVLRNLALPPQYGRLVVQEIEVMGVRWLVGGAVIAVVERGADGYACGITTVCWVTPRDFLTGIAKSIFFGALVTLVGCYNGLSSQGGTEGLGRATTATVVHVAMGVIVSDFFLTKIFLMIFW